MRYIHFIKTRIAQHNPQIYLSGRPCFQPIKMILPEEILMHVFDNLEFNEIMWLKHVSKEFKKILDGYHFWMSIYAKKFPILNASMHEMTLKQLQQCFIVVKKRSDSKKWFSNIWKGQDDNPEISIASPIPLLPTQKNLMSSGYSMRSRRICLSSSQDRDMEILENVLRSPKDVDDWSDISSGHRVAKDIRMNVFKSWWSSSPSPSKDDTSDTLLFGSFHGKSIITEVAIQALRDPAYNPDINLRPWSVESKIYSWPKLSIQIYSIPVSVEEGSDNAPFFFCQDRTENRDFNHRSFRDSNDRFHHKECIDDILRDHIPVYESPIYKVSEKIEDKWQCYRIADCVIGNVIAIKLHGKRMKQFDYTGFYACVERVAIQGVPLLQQN